MGAAVRQYISWIVSALRELAYEERDNSESMAHGHGRALLDAASILEAQLDETPA
jgi:hypothetical protein